MSNSAADAQSIPDSTLTAIQQFIVDEYLENDSESVDLLEDIQTWLDNPIPLNSSTLEDWLRLPFVDIQTVQAILRFREVYGRFESVTELQSVPDILDSTFILLRPFVYCDTSDFDRKRGLETEDHESFARANVSYLAGRRLERSRGFLQGEYAGNPWRSQIRASITFGNRISLNMLTDKDPGEKAFRLSGEGFSAPDHVSYNLQFRNIGPFEHLVIGDFKVQFGQGLFLWTGPTMGRSSEQVRTENRRSTGLKPSISSSESTGFRGVGLRTQSVGPLTVTTFFSRRKHDARIESDEMGNRIIARFLDSGLHRTETELANRLNVDESVFGGFAEFVFAKHRISVAGVRRRTSRPIRSISDETDNGFTESGTSASFAYSRNTEASSIFSEIGIDEDQDIAAKIGIQLYPSRLLQITWSLLVFPESYSPRFGSIFRGFGEGVSSEYGIFAGFRITTGKRFSASGFLESLLTPTTSNKFNRPVNGTKARFDLHLATGNNINVRFSLRGKWLPETAGLSTRNLERIEFPAATRLSSVRLQLEVPLIKRVLLTIRTDLSKYDSSERESNKGFVAYQEIRWRPSSWFEWILRYTSYKVDSFDARVYVFETDHRYVIRTSQFNGVGERLYMMARLNPGKKLRMSFKYAFWSKFDAETFGDGKDEINSDTVNDVSFQIEWNI